MEKQEQNIEAMTKEIAQLKKLVLSLSLRVKRLEQDNVRIKHDARQTKSTVTTISSRTRGS